MKASIILLYLLGAATLLLSCSKLSFQSSDSILGVPTTTPSTKAFTSSGQNDMTCEDVFVTVKDIHSYLRYKSIVTDTDLTECDFSPIVSSKGDTIMYAVNYPTGWELIAADKRCPAVLAYDNQGYFTYEDQIPPIQVWLAYMEKEIMQVRSISSYNEIDDPDVVDKMQNSQLFWTLITADSDDFHERISLTNRGLREIMRSQGNWVLHDIVIDTLINIHIDHLVQTHWDQNPPYNAYCPFKSNSTTQRAPAGCVAIAVGQVANYFNELCGYPEDAPLTAFCDAQVPANNDYYQASVSDPHMYVSNLNSSAWNSIPLNGDMCAKLLAEIGIDVNMKYYDGNASSDQLGESYFDDKCIFYTSGAFIKNPLISNLMAGKPVIVSAFPPYIPMQSQEGHAFIVDGYLHLRVRTTYYYEWQSDDPEPGAPIQIDLPYYESFFEAEQITMNWGWGANYDGGWFEINANWANNGYLLQQKEGKCYTI